MTSAVPRLSVESPEKKGGGWVTVHNSARNTRVISICNRLYNHSGQETPNRSEAECAGITGQGAS